MLRGGFDDQTRDRLREAHEAGRLDEMYAELAVDDEAAAEGVARRDARDRRAPASGCCPTTATAADGAGRGALPTDEVEAERADVAFEGMRALTRAQQGLIRQRDMLRRRAAPQGRASWRARSRARAARQGRHAAPHARR